MNLAINPLIALGVFAATAVTDAAYVFFNAAVVARHRVRAANWSAIWYLLSALRGDQLHGKSDLCSLRRARFLGGRLRVGHLAGPQRDGGGADETRSAVILFVELSMLGGIS